ncbi:MAG: ThiF family adenylyltransferase, partial [Kiritimatiellae bacterium]|nr:ThiF family adenylyltransferase [Kiritimatiellia bacterium]
RPPPSSAPIPEATSRAELLLGADAMQRLATARILVAGVGGVGAAVAETLVRSGCRNLHLADFDLLRASNLNRHPFATASTLDRPKLEAARDRLLDIAPDLNLVLHPVFINAETAAPLLAQAAPELLVDAIDSLNPKTELLLAAETTGIPHILSCLGAARKLDPMAFRIALLDHTHTCPLARLLRKRLRHRIAHNHVIAVFSVEPPQPLSPGAPPPSDDDFLVGRGRLRSPMGSYAPCTLAEATLAAATAIRLLSSSPPAPTSEPTA